MNTKTMLAISALCAAVAFQAKSEVVSSDIVGYQTQAEGTGFQFIATPFTMTDGGEDFTLADFQTNCDETGTESTGWEEKVDAIVVLDATGSFVRRLVYVPEWYADGEEYTKGWYDGTEAVEDTYTTPYDDTFEMPFGYGVQISISGDRGQAVTYSGKVKSTPTILDLPTGFSIVGNCACKDLTLSNLLTNCDETGTESTGWEEKIDAVVELDNTGSYVRRLVYVPEWYADGEEYTKGWYDGTEAVEDTYTTELGSSVTFGQGKGFQVAISGSRGQKITIKSALAD